MNKIIQKISVSIATAALLVSSFSGPAIAAGKSAPKATGDYGYFYGGVQRHASFDAQQSATCSALWNVTNTYTFNVIYQGNTYSYTTTLSQAGTTVTGTLNDPYLPGILTIFNGTLSGNTLTFSVDYGAGSVQGVRTFTGTVSAGILSGTWNETGSEAGSDTWTSTGATATATNSCTGKGSFNYSDNNGIFYTIDVRYVNIDTTNKSAYFAGPIVAGNFGDPTQWLFVKVIDNGEPGINDTSTGDYPVTASQAQIDVASKASPSISPININSGNIQVH